MNDALALLLIGINELPADLKKLADEYKAAYLRSAKADDQYMKWQAELRESSALLVSAQNKFKKSLEAFVPKDVQALKDQKLTDAPVKK